jgi:hypothetical protein
LISAAAAVVIGSAALSQRRNWHRLADDIEERKLTQYLLASGHPTGRAKAAFFQRFGLSSAQGQILRDALHGHLQSARIVAVSETQFGKSIRWKDGCRHPMVESSGFEQFGSSRPDAEIGDGLRCAGSRAMIKELELF